MPTFSSVRSAALALLVGGVMVGRAADVHAEDSPAAQEGKRAFKAGVLLLQDPDGAKYDEALLEFRRAYDTLGNWKVLGNIGLCALKLERDGEAIEAYEKYLAGGGKEIDKDEREQVGRDLLRLRTQLVKVHVDTAAGVQLTDDRMTSQGAHVVNLYPLKAASVDLGLHPGHHVFIAKNGQQDAKWEVDLAPASSMSHRFELTAPSSGLLPPTVAPADTGVSAPIASTTPSRTPTLAYIAGGIGVLGVGAGIFFAIQHGSKVSASQDLCTGPDGRCPSSRKTDIDALDSDARTTGALSVAGFVVGAVGLGTGITLLLSNKSSTTTTGANQTPSLSPWIGARSAGVTGRF